MNFEPGAKLGPYQVVSRLGRGGMGEVYRARDVRLGREVALKVLARGPAADPEHRRRFEQEAKAASALSHPNVAQIYDVGLEDGVFYLAMELVEGRTLRQMMRHGEDGSARPLAIERVLELGIQIARGIARAHERGVVHRDLKPENVMVTPEGWVKILDFGLAKLTSAWLDGNADDETIDHIPTRVGQLIGTAEYMSPEQAAGRPVDHRSDQFSLGSMLYEMTTGQFAFRRESPVLTLAAILEREPEPIAETADGPLKPGFETVVRRCLRKQPTDRYATTDELVAALEAVAAAEASDDIAPRSSPLTAEALAIIERTENTGGAIGELRAAALELRDEIGAEIGLLKDSRYYFVQGRDGRSKRVVDRELIHQVRRARFSGAELIRRGDETEWRPLAELELFRKEMPDLTALRALRRKRVRRFVAHAAGYSFAAAATAVLMQTGWSILEGHWSELAVMLVWGMGLGVHGLIVWRSRASLSGGDDGARLVPRPQAALQPPAAAMPRNGPRIANHLARVRQLIDERGGAEAPHQLAELRQLEAVLSELERRHLELSTHVSDGARAAIVDDEVRAQASLDRATTAADRQLHEDHLRTLRERRAAIDHARAERGRVSVRLELAEHQVKRLLLDLTRDAAAAIDTPELSSRLQVIRSEADLELE